MTSLWAAFGIAAAILVAVAAIARARATIPRRPR